MDIRQLKVGQTVNLVSGFHACEAEVLEITPRGVIVQTTDFPEKFRLDVSGRAVDSRDLGWTPNHLSNGAWEIPGTFEHGPWRIEDTEGE
jgi:hypothetical protein